MGSTDVPSPSGHATKPISSFEDICHLDGVNSSKDTENPRTTHTWVGKKVNDLKKKLSGKKSGQKGFVQADCEIEETSLMTHLSPRPTNTFIPDPPARRLIFLRRYSKDRRPIEFKGGIQDDNMEPLGQRLTKPMTPEIPPSPSPPSQFHLKEMIDFLATRSSGPVPTTQDESMFVTPSPSQ